MLHRLQVHHFEQAHIVHQRRKQGGNTHLGIGNARHVGKHEGGGSHNGRHDLSACGCHSLHSAGKAGLVTVAFHQGNGECTGTHHIGHATAGDGAEKSAGHHGHFGRAAPFLAGERDSDVLKNLAGTGGVEISGEQQKKVDVGGGGGHGGAIHAPVTEYRQEYPA